MKRVRVRVRERVRESIECVAHRRVGVLSRRSRYIKLIYVCGVYAV